MNQAHGMRAVYSCVQLSTVPQQGQGSRCGALHSFPRHPTAERTADPSPNYMTIHGPLVALENLELQQYLGAKDSGCPSGSRKPSREAEVSCSRNSPVLWRKLLHGSESPSLGKSVLAVSWWTPGAVLLLS